MEPIAFSVLLSCVWACFLVFISSLIRRRSGPDRLPPGPFPFPVIGNILSLGNRPHESLAALSKTYGPLMSLKLGSTTTIVISSPSLAREATLKHDHVLSSRSVPDSVHAHGHHEASMVWMPVTDQWRSLRKISKEQVFAAQRLDESTGLRLKKVQELVDHVHLQCKSGNVVNIRHAAFTTSLNVLWNTFFSVDLAQYDSDVSQRVNEIVCAIMEIAGKPNLADYFPILKWVDPHGVRRMSGIYFGKLMAIFEDIIEQRLQSGASMESGEDVLGVLLNLTKQSGTHRQLNCNDIKHLLLDFFAAGTDTTSVTVEWAMTELLKSPKAMAKAQAELRDVLGSRNNSRVQELDIPKLPYLQAIVKETFRFHPPISLLLPRKAESNVTLCGFTLPKNSQVIINAWAIGRDSDTWSNPNLFMPERFLGVDIDVKGGDFELIPFGAGRRICPGLPLASRMVHLMLATLLHTFDWKLEEGLKPEDVDVSDKFGFTLQKVQPLKAIPVEP